MIVLCDTSPLNYLILIGKVDILPTLFGEIFVPGAVIEELAHPGSSDGVRLWVASLPDWLIVKEPQAIESDLNLGRGEAAAISLALECQADLLLIDDRKGCRAAKTRGLAVAGTLNVLEKAAKLKLLDLSIAIADLRQTNFRIAEKVLTRMLEDDALRGDEP